MEGRGKRSSEVNSEEDSNVEDSNVEDSKVEDSTVDDSNLEVPEIITPREQDLMHLPSFQSTTKSTAGWLDRFEMDDREQTIDLNEEIDSIDQTENNIDKDQGEVLSRQARKSGYVTSSAKFTFDATQMAQMFLLTAAPLSFDFKSVRDQATHKGVVVDIVPLDEHYADALCDTHKNDRDGFARYEAKLIQGASKIVDFVHEVNADQGSK